MPNKTLYDVLGVSREASPNEIRKAYKTKAQRLHPDKETGDEGAFKEVLDAYEVLMDETRRKYYDDTGEIPEERRPAFFQEAVLIVLGLIDKVPSVKTVNLICEARNVVAKAAIRVSNMRAALEEQIGERREAASRMVCGDGDNILQEAIIADIARKEKELAEVDRLAEEGQQLTDYFKKYSYITDSTGISTASTTSSTLHSATFSGMTWRA